MADESLSSPPTSDSLLRLGFLRNPDGSIIRPELPPELTKTTPISSYHNTPVVAKDITINPSHNLWIRLFIPRQIFESPQTPPPKLPVIIYFIGGGFLYRQADLTFYEDFYKTITVDTLSVFISVSYRLAPENRLPAPYDDGMEILNWIKNTPDDWLTKFADTSNTWLMGSSAGGNIVYQVGLRSSSAVEDLKPLNIKGLIIAQPFFGGIKRTESEIKFIDDKVASIRITDALWDVTLPVGADRDHEYCNPMTTAAAGGGGGNDHRFDRIKELGWKILVMVQKGDPLSDRQIELFNVLKEKGLDLMGMFVEGGSHSYGSPELDKAVIEFVKSAMYA